MIPVVLTFDDEALEKLGDGPDLIRGDADEDPLSITALQDLLAELKTADVEVFTTVEHPDWEEGNPCPECDGRSISVLSADEDIYDSFEGLFEYAKSGDAHGGYVSALCPECMTVLFDAPAEKMWR